MTIVAWGNAPGFEKKRCPTLKALFNDDPAPSELGLFF
jgi:hypothetical protein